MKMYGYGWADKIVWKWYRSDPRVDLMIDYFTTLEEERGTANPRSFVHNRIVRCLQLSRSSNRWDRLKDMVHHKIAWPAAYDMVVRDYNTGRIPGQYKQADFTTQMLGVDNDSSTGEN